MTAPALGAADRRGTSIAARARRLWYSDPSTIELASGIAALLWGVALAVPGDTFVARPDYYGRMAGVAGELAWSAAFILLGALQGWIAVQPNCRCRLARQLVGLAALGLWVFVAGAVVLRWPLSAGSAPHLVLILGTWWAFLRAGDRLHVSA